MSSERHIIGQPSTARLGRPRVNNPNEPMACAKCGSIFFTEMQAQMYTTGGYGFRAVSNAPMKVFKCLCGELQVPTGMNSGNPAGGERDLFAQSVATALAYQAEVGIEAAAKGFAGVHELREVQAQVADLQAQLAQGVLLPGAESVTIEGDVEHAEVTEGDLTQQEIESETEGDPAGPGIRDLSSRPPIARGNRGRSEAGATPPSGDVTFVAPPQRTVAEGGARGRMRRQGGQ